MGKGKIFLLLLLMVFLSNCTAFQSIQVLEEEYQSPVKDYNTSLTILPLTEDYISSELLDEYLSKEENSPSLISRTNKDIYYNYFGLTFSETMTGNLNDLMQSGIPDFISPVSFKDTILVLSKNAQMDVLVPETGKLFGSEQATDFTLLTQSIMWETGFVEEQSKPLGGNNVQRVEFTLKLKYILWDNKKEQIAGYGQINERRNLTGLPERIFFIQLFEDISRLIVRQSPMQERYR